MDKKWNVPWVPEATRLLNPAGQGKWNGPLYGNPFDFSKIYDIVMNDEIKLTYLLFSVYLSVLFSLRPFGAIYRRLGSPSKKYYKAGV